MAAVRIEAKHSILHAALSYDLTVLHAQLMDQRVCVGVVEAVASRDLWRFVLEDGGEVRIFSIEINQVGAEVPLLQHVAAPGQVVNPWRSLFRPGFIAVEPLSKWAKCQSR